MTIFTFGYGNRKNYDDLSRHLECHEIDRIVDVRRYPSGWSPMWCEAGLKDFCKSKSVKYLSKKELGNVSGASGWTPPDSQKAEIALHQVADLADKGAILLMCAERDHRECHRTEVADRLQGITGLTVEHLK